MTSRIAQVARADGETTAHNGLSLVWAKDGGEWWPAHLLSIDEGESGWVHVSFIGWGRRHNVALPPDMIRQEEPQRQRARPEPFIISEAPSPDRKRARNNQLSPAPSATQPASPADTAKPRPKKLKLKIAVPSGFACAACGGGGTAAQMVRCSHGGCESWVHRCCAGLSDVAPPPASHARRLFTCPVCAPPPSEDAWAAVETDAALRRLEEDNLEYLRQCLRERASLRRDGDGDGDGDEASPWPVVTEVWARGGEAVPGIETATEAAAIAGAAGAGGSRSTAPCFAAPGPRDPRLQAEHQLLEALYADRLMESDVRKHLRRHGLSTGSVAKRLSFGEPEGESKEAPGGSRVGHGMHVLACDKATALRERLIVHLQGLLSDPVPEGEQRQPGPKGVSAPIFERAGSPAEQTAAAEEPPPAAAADNATAIAADETAAAKPGEVTTVDGNVRVAVEELVLEELAEMELAVDALAAVAAVAVVEAVEAVEVVEAVEAVEEVVAVVEEDAVVVEEEVVTWPLSMVWRWAILCRQLGGA